MSVPLPQSNLVTPEGAGYVPGVCNIGPWETRRRRTFGFIGIAVAILLFLLLVGVGAPPIARILILFPAWGGTLSWLQARRRFCAGFAMAGITNFADGDEGRAAITDPAEHRADIAATARMTRDSFLIALPVTIVAVLLPV